MFITADKAWKREWTGGSGKKGKIRLKCRFPELKIAGVASLPSKHTVKKGSRKETAKVRDTDVAMSLHEVTLLNVYALGLQCHGS